MSPARQYVSKKNLVAKYYALSPKYEDDSKNEFLQSFQPTTIPITQKNISQQGTLKLIETLK